MLVQKFMEVFYLIDEHRDFGDIGANGHIGIYGIQNLYLCGGAYYKEPPGLLSRIESPRHAFPKKRIVEQMSKLIHKQNKFWHITLMLLVMLYYANMVITNQVVAVIGGLYYEDNN